MIQQLSSIFFQECQDLYKIQASFPFSSINFQLERRDLLTEFELIRALTQTKKHKIRLRTNSVIQNKKNRYPQQSIYQHSRIILPSQIYINANIIPTNTIDNKLIISQAPLQSTIEQFNELLKSNSIQCVVMVCNLIQNGKIKCYDYLIDKQCEKNQENSTNKKYNIESNIVYVDKMYSYQHLMYSEWPDRGIPQNMYQIEALLLKIIKFKRILVHCSAGLGRSGVITVLIKIMQDYDSYKDSQISIFALVRKIRQYRYGAIQNSQQYKFIYEFVRFLVDKQKGRKNQ